MPTTWKEQPYLLSDFVCSLETLHPKTMISFWSNWSNYRTNWTSSKALVNPDNCSNLVGTFRLCKHLPSNVNRCLKAMETPWMWTILSIKKGSSHREEKQPQQTSSKSRKELDAWPHILLLLPRGLHLPQSRVPESPSIATSVMEKAIMLAIARLQSVKSASSTLGSWD